MRRWIRRAIASLSLLGLFYACPGPSWADNISQITGIAAKDTSASLTWRHVLAIPSNIFGTGAFTTSATRYLAGSYAVVAGCQSVACTAIAAAGVLAPNGDGFLSGNQSLLTIAHLYVSDPATGPPFNWNRLRSGLANTDPNGYLNVILRSRNGDTWQSNAIADNQNPTITNGWFNTLSFKTGTGGNVFKEWLTGFAGTAPQACSQCPVGTQYALVANSTDAGGTSWRAWSGQPVQGSGVLTNSQTVSAANTAVTVTLAATASSRSHVYKITGRCSAGTSNLTITHGGTTVWSTGAAEIGTVNFREEWATGLTGPVNSAAVMTLATCGAGNTGTLMVQSDIF